jgi:hypothetical protein
MLEGSSYLRTYPYTVLGPLWLKMKNASGEMALLDPETLSALPDERLTALARRTFRPGAINIQKYIADQGAYPRWHCELHPQLNDPTCENLHRTLLWTIYLNDGFGEAKPNSVPATQDRAAHRQPADRAGRVHPHASRQRAEGRRQVHRHVVGAVSARRSRADHEVTRQPRLNQGRPNNSPCGNAARGASNNEQSSVILRVRS